MREGNESIWQGFITSPGQQVKGTRRAEGLGGTDTRQVPCKQPLHTWQSRLSFSELQCPRLRNGKLEEY